MTATRFVGHSIKRLEDRPLLTGAGRFVADLRFADMLEAAFVRSPHAHAELRAIDVRAAQQYPGVHAVFTLADLAPLLAQERLPLQFRTAQLPPDITPLVLAKDEVAFVGEAVAVVIAQTRYIAEDAAALVAVDYRPLSAVSDCRQALAPGAPRVHSARASNLLTEFRQSYGDVADAFARAPRRASVKLKQHRGGAHSIEGRGAIAVYDDNEDRLTLWSSTQLAHEVRAFLMMLLRLDENQLRVVAPDVGGGFGAKFVMYPEEVTLAAASLLLRRPIKWIEDRREHFLAAVQERDQYWDLDVAFDNDGRLLGVRGEMIHDEGAYTPQGINLPYNASTALPGPYMLPAYQLDVRVAETNKVATMPVRGAGYPEGAFAMERLLDRIADELGLDRAEVRRRNLVPPEKMPYVSPLKTRAGSPVALDSGDFLGCQRMALDAIDYAGFAARQAHARAEGRYLGIGLGNGVKGTGRGPFESGIVRIGRSGRISVYTGAMPMGQGIKTALAQICAEQFDVAPDSVAVAAGDTAVIPYGQGGFASRQTVTAGSAVHLAAVAVRDKALKVAAHLLEVSVSDLELRDGRIEIAGAPGSGLTLARSRRSGRRRSRLFHAGQVRARARKHAELPAECAHLWRRMPCRRGGGRYRDVRGEDPALCRGQRQRPRHQSDDRGRTTHRRRGARDRQCPVRMDGLRRRGATDHHHPCRLCDPGSDRGAQDRNETGRVPLPAQSARREGRRRIRLRARDRRDHLGGGERARPVRRAHRGISGHAGPAVCVAVEHGGKTG